MKKPTRDQIIAFLYLFVIIEFINIAMNISGVNFPNWILAIIHGPMLGIGFVLLYPFHWLPIYFSDGFFWALVAFGGLITTPLFWTIVFYYPYRKFVYLKLKK